MNAIPVDTSAVAGVLLSAPGADGKILLLERQKEGYWCHVAGRIEKDESAAQAMVREFREETGVQVNTLYSADYVDTFIDTTVNRLRLVPVFAAYWPDKDLAPVLNKEHTQYRWCSLEEAVKLAPYPNQHRLFRHVWENFVAGEPDPRTLVNP